jgi:hypothetical protein
MKVAMLLQQAAKKPSCGGSLRVKAGHRRPKLPGPTRRLAAATCETSSSQKPQQWLSNR